MHLRAAAALAGASGAGSAGRRPAPIRSAVVLAALLAVAGSVSPLGGEPLRVEPFRPDPAAVLAGDPVGLPVEWAFEPDGDGPPPAAVEDLTAVDARLRRGETPPSWHGEAWFLLPLEVPAELVDRPLALSLRTVGAAEIWLDGDRLGSRGAVVGASAAERETAVSTRVPVPLRFERAGAHRLAVRYRNPAVEPFQRSGAYGGFSLQLGTAEAVARAVRSHLRTLAFMTWWFSAIFVSFGFLHLCIWLFQRGVRDHLWFAGLCLANASLAFFLYYKEITDVPGFRLVSEPTMNVSGLAWGLCGVGFVYSVFAERWPRRLYTVAALLAAAVAAWSLADTIAALPSVFLFMFASCFEMARVVVVAIRRRRSGAWLIGCGLLALALGFGLALLRNLGVFPRSVLPGNLLPFVSMVVLIGFMSLYLSSEMARTQRELRHNLAEVERLSAERLEQERQAQRRETERRLLEAEVRRKTEELEEARALQLSMLPASLPDRADLDVATHIETATEVGGDYYDFAGDEGGLVVAIGDATGHGMRAGTMVTATKALFGLLGHDDLSRELAASNRALRRMNLRRLAMAFTLARFEPGRVRVAAAGMPPVLVRRAGSGEVESIELRGTPLGALPGFPYEQTETGLEAGDVVLFLSDGLPELLSPAGDEVGYGRVAERLAACDASTAQGVVDDLVRFAAEWSAGRPADDDVTFVVVRVEG